MSPVNIWRYKSGYFILLLLLLLLLLLSLFASLYADLPSFLPPSLITGDSHMPGFVLELNNTTVYLLELSVSFVSNITVSSDRKAAN